MKQLVMIIEDEEALIAMLKYNLEKEGFDVCVSMNGEEAVDAVKFYRPNLIIMDWMLPVMSGVDICKQIRYNHDLRDIPVIMLTARSEEADKVKGLTSGADDYMTKPFSVPELIARIWAILRRVQSVEKQGGELVFEDIRMDLGAHRVTRGERTVHLGPTEFRLLQFFLEHPKQVFPRESLLKEVWGADIHVELRTVDVHVRRLRKALNHGDEKDFIRTVRTAGYSIDTEEK